MDQAPVPRSLLGSFFSELDLAHMLDPDPDPAAWLGLGLGLGPGLGPARLLLRHRSGICPVLQTGGAAEIISWSGPSRTAEEPRWADGRPDDININLDSILSSR